MDFNEQWKQCPRGHWYDPSITSVCPQCEEEDGTVPSSSRGVQEYGATEPISRGAGSAGKAAGGRVEEYGATEPATGGFQGVLDFDRVRSGSYSGTSGIPDYDNMDLGVTMPQNNGGNRPMVEDYGPTEPPFVNQIHGFQPVVGWLVCVEGPDRGRDYRIHAGYNSIGRAAHMDICISGDLKISREKQAIIAFDPDERIFFFGPADGKSLLKLNGKTLMMPSELHPYDTLTIGTSKFKFVPFCGDQFSWENE